MLTLKEAWDEEEEEEPEGEDYGDEDTSFDDDW